MTVTVLRTNGTRETHTVTRGDLATIRQLIGCTTIDTVTLTRDGSGARQVMIVDDDGYDVEVIDHGRQPHPRTGQVMQTWERRPVRARKPVNAAATALYHAKCGGDTGHQIVGDVALVDDRDFA